MRKKKVVVRDEIQHEYTYHLTEPVGRNFDPEFTPTLTPKEMLRLGVFGGVYMRDGRKSFPRVGLRVQSLQRMNLIKTATTSRYTRANRSLFGKRKDGFTKMTHAVGFSGTAATTWAAAFRKRTNGKLNVGKQSNATPHK